MVQRYRCECEPNFGKQIMKRTLFAALSASLLLSACGYIASPTNRISTNPTLPGAYDMSRVSGGNYSVDSNHTLVTWSVNHFGFNKYSGQFSQPTGILTLDTNNPSAAMVDITIPMSGIVTGADGLTKHLKTADFFNAEVYPTARFVSTSVVPTGMDTAAINGNLTLGNVTRPVTLNATFVGAGTNPMSKKENVGFHATASLNRSDYGIKYALPMVSDRVDLDITVAFTK